MGRRKAVLASETSGADACEATRSPLSCPGNRRGWGVRQLIRLEGETRSELERGRGLLRKAITRGSMNAARLLGAASARLPPNRFGGLCGIAEAAPPTAEHVLLGYAQCLFPMDFRGKLRWHCPDPRFVLYLSELRLSPKMRRDLRKANYTYTFDQAPREVLDACSERPEGTWLSERLKHTLLELHKMGAMHSVEAWKDSTLVGGSYGLSIGQVWTGETMFHRAPNAGKAQFAHLATHLAARGFQCVDAQAYSEHFARFGAREIPLAEYRALMARGLLSPASFGAGLGPAAKPTGS